MTASMAAASSASPASSPTRGARPALQTLRFHGATAWPNSRGRHGPRATVGRERLWEDAPLRCSERTHLYTVLAGFQGLGRADITEERHTHHGTCRRIFLTRTRTSRRRGPNRRLQPHGSAPPVAVATAPTGRPHREPSRPAAACAKLARGAASRSGRLEAVASDGCRVAAVSGRDVLAVLDRYPVVAPRCAAARSARASSTASPPGPRRADPTPRAPVSPAPGLRPDSGRPAPSRRAGPQRTAVAAEGLMRAGTSAPRRPLRSGKAWP
jgi:hypothetical protein